MLFMPKNSLIKLTDNLLLFLVSFAGLGFIKPASATWGSLGAGVILFFFYPNWPYLLKILIIVTIFIFGVLAADYIERKRNLHDPHFIVIDEVVGMMITTFFLEAVWWQYLMAFICFRIFDIAKLWPASYFDKRRGGFSLMIDDVLMAIPSLLLTYLIIYLCGTLI